MRTSNNTSSVISPKGRLGFIGVLLFLMLQSAQGASSLNWQHVLPGESVTAIGVMGETFVAVKSDEILTSTDGINWESTYVLDGETVDQALFMSDGLTLFTRTDYSTQTPEFSVLHSPDLVDWEVMYQHSGIRNTLWQPLQEVGGTQVMALVSPEGSIVLASQNGIEWDETFQSDELFFTGVYRTPDDRYLLSVIPHNTFPVWIETTDGYTWIRHNGFFGSYVEFNGLYIGITEDGLVCSSDFENWDSYEFFDVDDPQHRGPTTLLHGSDRVLIVRNARQTFVTLDGTDWIEGTLPPMPEVSGISCPLTFSAVSYEGYFWIRRKWALPPFVDPPEEAIQDVVHRSVDGLNWEPAEWPEDLVNEGAAIVLEGEDLPEDVLPIHWITRAQPGVLSENGLRLEIRQIPDIIRYALYQTLDNGPEEVAMTSWGVEWEPQFPYVEPLQLVTTNGVYLCRNELGYLGFLDPENPRLAQSRVKCETPWRTDAIVVSWSAVPDAVSYKLIRSVTGGGENEFVEVTETQATTFTDQSPELEKGEIYTYHVLAQRPDMLSNLPARGDRGRLWTLMGDLVPVSGSFSDLADNWKSLGWFETLYVEDLPWVWSEAHQWWYIKETKVGFWILDGTLGWLWSDVNLYPFLYSSNHDNWLFYQRGSLNPRWFYDFKSAQWTEVN